MNRTSEGHPGWQDFVDALESADGLPPAMRAHVDRCSGCHASYAMAARLLVLLQSTRFPAIPEELVTRTLDRVLSERRAPRAEGLPVWQRLLASLRARLDEIETAQVLDSLAASNAWRGGGPGAAARTLLFEADAYSVTLVLQADARAGGDNLRGQVIPVAENELPSGSCALLHWSDEVAQSSLSDSGEFGFEAVPRAPLRLALVLGRQFLTLGPLPARAP